MKVPKLRFPGFVESWQLTTLGKEILYGRAGGTPSTKISKYYNGDIGFLSINDMRTQGKYIKTTDITITQDGLENSSAWIIPSNHLLYSMYASVGYPAINKIELTTSQAIYAMKLKDNNNIEYFYYYLDRIREGYIKSMIETGSQGNLNATLVKNIQIIKPGKNEQQKIGEFFASLDREIELYKIMLNNVQLLRQNYMITKLNSISKKDLEKIKLKKILKPYTKKNKAKELFEIVAVGKYGIRSRDEIYKNELSGNIQNMKIIYKNTMVFGMGTKQIDFGVVYDDDIYLVSGAYKTFEINHVDAFIFNEIFKVYNDYFSKKHMIIGARQGKSIDFSGLMNETIKYPKNTKIINEMKNNILQIDEYLSVLNKKISLLEKRKKAFLQQMFV